MARTVVVTALPGVGASRVCERTRRRLGDEYTLINVGDVMLEAALEHGLADTRDGLAHLPPRDQRLLQRRAGEHVARKATEGPLLVNTHLVVHTDAGFVPGLPGDVRMEMDPSVLVVVDAEPETILGRRERSERTYPSDGRSVVEFHQQLQSAAALTYSATDGIPIRHVDNDDDLDAAVDDLTAIAEPARR